jgi:hypothetical protein
MFPTHTKAGKEKGKEKSQWDSPSCLSPMLSCAVVNFFSIINLSYCRVLFNYKLFAVVSLPKGSLGGISS